MSQLVTITLEFNDWNTIHSAMYRQAGELAAHEARRTGGRGYASGSIIGQVADLHRIQDTIKSALEKSNADAEHASNQAG